MIGTIVGVALVNQPNVLNEALNKQEQNQKNNKEEKNLNQNKEELDYKKLYDQEVEKNAQAARNTKIEIAAAKGELALNKVEFAKTLSDKQLDTYLDQNKQDMEYLKKPTNVEANERKTSMSQEELEVCRQLGLEPQEGK